jgi:hypothetical protein
MCWRHYVLSDVGVTGNILRTDTYESESKMTKGKLMQND